MLSCGMRRAAALLLGLFGGLAFSPTVALTRQLGENAKLERALRKAAPLGVVALHGLKKGPKSALETLDRWLEMVAHRLC